MFSKSFFLSLGAVVAASTLPSRNVELAIIVETEQNVDTLNGHLENLAKTLTHIGETFDSNNLTLSISYHLTSNIRHADCFATLASQSNSYLPLPWDQVVSSISSPIVSKGVPSETATTRAIPFLAHNGYSPNIYNTRRVMMALVTSNATWSEEENSALRVGQSIECHVNSEPSVGQVFRSLKNQQIGLLVHKIGSDFADLDEWTRAASANNYKDFVELTLSEDTTTGEEAEAAAPAVDQAASDEPPVVEFANEMSAVETSLRGLMTSTSGKKELVPGLSMDHTKQCEVQYGNWEHIITVDLTSKKSDRLMHMAGALGVYIGRFVEKIEELGGVSKAAVYFIREHNDPQQWCFTRARRIKESSAELGTFLASTEDSSYTPQGLGNAVIVEALHWSMRTFSTLQNHPGLPQFRFFSLFTYSVPTTGLEPYTYPGISFPCEEESPFSLDVAMKDFEQWKVRFMVYVADDNDDADEAQMIGGFWESLIKSRLSPDQSMVVVADNEDADEDALQLQAAYQTLMCLDI